VPYSKTTDVFVVNYNNKVLSYTCYYVLGTKSCTVLDTTVTAVEQVDRTSVKGSVQGCLLLLYKILITSD